MGDLLAAGTHAPQILSPSAYLALIVVVGVLGQWLAWRLRMPSILVLLLVGFGLGRVADPDAILGRNVLFAGVTITVGIILFESSMSLRIRQARDLGKPVLRLCTVTVVAAWVLITFSALAVGFALQVALLVGAILVVTGPTVIAPILRALRPTRRIASLLRWEGIVVDPIGAVLGVLVFQGVLAGGVGEALPTVLLSLVKTVVIGFGIALALGYLLDFLMRRHAIPDFLHGVVFLAAAVGALLVSNSLQDQSGLITVTVLGVFLGNRSGLHLEHVQEFKENLQVLFVGSLFVVLAGRVSPAEVWNVAPQALAFLALLVVVVRPVSVLLGLLGTRVSRAERTLLACMAPRGIVAAAVTSIFALEFVHAAQSLSQQARSGGSPALTAQAKQLAALATQTNRMVPLVFLVIVCTVALYGLGVGRLAERLGLASTSPQGILFAGVNSWTVDAARLLDELGVPTLIVAREYVDLSRARMAGLRTVTANVLSEYVVKDLDLFGIGSLVACTSDDEHNATAAREFIHDLGRANVFQLRRTDSGEAEAHERTVAAGHLSGRFAFVPALTHGQLRERAETLSVRRSDLSEDFTLSDFKAAYDGRAVVLFVHKDGRTVVANEETKLPERDATLIAMLPEPAALPEAAPVSDAR